MASQMKRIFVVSTYSPTSRGFGGITHSVTAYLKLLSSMSLDTYFLGSNGSLQDRVTAAGIKKNLPNINVALYTPMLHKRWGIGPGLLLHLPKVVFADFIFLNGPRTLTTILVGIIARLFRKRYVFISHASLDTGRVKRTYRKHPLTFTLAEPLFCFSVNGAEWIIVTGRAEEENLDRAFKKIRVARVENFFDIDLPFTEPSDIGNGRRYIFVGRIESDKGILSFVRVWKVTAGPNDRLCIAGSGAGEYAEHVLRALRSDDRITYVGEVSQAEVFGLLTQAHVLVLPTGLDDPVIENFGNAVAEALIHSRPVMVTSGMHWDEYADSEAVMIFEPNVEAASRVIKYFSEIDRDTYHGMCVTAYELGKHFNMNNARETIQSIIEGRGAAGR